MFWLDWFFLVRYVTTNDFLHKRLFFALTSDNRPLDMANALLRICNIRLMTL